MSTDKQIDANRENAQHSTGPTSEEGKEISSFNRFKHGLCGRFMMIAGESPQDFNRLVTWLHEENTPGTTEETMLISKMAEHFWLAQRAQTLQTETLNAAEYEGAYGSLSRQERDQKFIAFMRYASNHERGFHKCQEKLRKLRNDREKKEIGFERLKIAQAQEKRKQDAQEARIAAEKTSETKAAESQIRSFIKKALPGRADLPFEQLEEVLKAKLQSFLDENPPPETA